MTNEPVPCPFCGGGLHLEDWPWCDGTPCFEIIHDDIDHATKMKCPLVMGGYDTEEEAIEVVNTRYKRTCKMMPLLHTTNPVAFYCSECDSTVYQVAKFCPNCGAEVVDGE